MRSRAVVTLAGMATGSGTVLGSGMPRFGDLARHLTAPHRWVAEEGSDAALGALAGALLWLVAFWVALGLALTAGSLLPGQTGRIARGLAHRLTPAVLRRAVVTAAGASILLSPATALAAPAAGGPTTPAATQPAMPAVGWVTDPSPSVAAASRTPPPVAPTKPATTTAAVAAPTTATDPHRSPPPGNSGNAPPPAAADPPPPPGSASPSSPPAPAPPAPADPVTVQPGDSLWSIAAQHLTGNRSAARIAQAWPRWYAANRQAIGSRPDLIRPGTRLAAPPSTGSESGA